MKILLNCEKQKDMAKAMSDKENHCAGREEEKMDNRTHWGVELFCFYSFIIRRGEGRIQCKIPQNNGAEKGDGRGKTDKMRGNDTSDEHNSKK